MTWRVATSLNVLLDTVNDQAPNRSIKSDGSIGDAAHASRESDHNPWVIDDDGTGVVRARDFTHDPHGGLDCQALADSLVALYWSGHPAMKSGAYTIWNGRIYSYDRRSEGWRPYTDPNAHTQHLHQSVATAAAGYDSAHPWNITTNGDNVTPEQLQKAVDAAIRDNLDEIAQATTRHLLATDLTPHNNKADDRTLRGVLNRLAGRAGGGK